jgi:hypothetical protein
LALMTLDHRPDSIQERKRLAQCTSCKRYFIADRSDWSPWCLRPKCRRKYGAARVKENYANEKAKSEHKKGKT